MKKSEESESQCREGVLTQRTRLKFTDAPRADQTELLGAVNKERCVIQQF